MQLSQNKAFIFARGGSKGVKDKNIRMVGGKPLIAHSIDCALKSKYISEVIVSTDSPKIAEIAQEYGASILKRDPELAQDQTPELLAWRHAIQATYPNNASEEKLFISLPATSPLRIPIDIDRAVERFTHRDCDIVFGISPSHRSPYLNMVKINQEDLIETVINMPNAARRQDVPVCYDITTSVYVASISYVLSTSRPIDGRVAYVLIPPQRAFDIDTEFDLYLTDLLLKNPYKKDTVL